MMSLIGWCPSTLAVTFSLDYRCDRTLLFFRHTQRLPRLYVLCTVLDSGDILFLEEIILEIFSFELADYECLAAKLENYFVAQIQHSNRGREWPVYKSGKFAM